MTNTNNVIEMNNAVANRQNMVQVFSNPEFGEVRVVMIDNEPWMVGKDIATALGYRNPQEAIRTHVDDEDKGVSKILTPGGRQNVPVINESGFYSLVLSSHLPTAREFKRWVTSEVLPSIRKHGGYLLGQEEMQPEELLSRALIYANSKIEEQKQVIDKQAKELEEAQPKIEFADAVDKIYNTIEVGDLAKILKQNGIDIGRNRLFAWLREHGYLVKTKGSFNMPTQYSMNLGLFNISESIREESNGAVAINRTARITGRGQKYFVKAFLKRNNTEDDNQLTIGG